MLILTTMVKNEEKALPRLIRSAAKIVDYVALSDTGSTDNTLEVARAVCKELNLPLSIEVREWKDFGTNRTLNLEHGRRVSAERGKPEEDYLLLLDADMEVPADVPKRPTEIPKVATLPQQSGTMIWSNLRIIRADVPGKYLGRTHEYLSHSETPQNLQWFTIIDHGDGGCKADKFERDERLLRMDLEENPNNYRSMFYLAQTLQCLGRKAEAVYWYDRRAQSEDFAEEAWMARYTASKCVTGFEQDVRALAAYYTRPQRAEPLADVACRASDRGQHRFALAIAKQGRAVPPLIETLWCNIDHCKWAFRYAEMVSAFYAGEMDLGAEACDFLHFTPGSPHAGVALDNIVHYTKVLPGERTPFPVDPIDGFNPASPCFAKHDDGWIAMIRMVNYQITKEGYFVIPGDKVITRNVIYHLDAKMRRVGRPTELISPFAPNPEAKITGFEDQRIVRIDGTKLITAGVRCDASPIGQPELWEATWDMSTGIYLEGRKLSKGTNVEKNWLPFNGGYLYNHNPQVIFLDGDGNNPVTISKPTINLTWFRGSAAPIPWRNGYLYVIHEVSHRGRRVYLHRFVHVQNDKWESVRVSRPFFLKGGPCMESCFSINLLPKGILMSCAYEDKEVYTISVSNETVINALKEGFHE